MANRLIDRMITEGLYAVGKNVDCNAYLLMEDGNGILIDPGPVGGLNRCLRMLRDCCLWTESHM